MAVRVSPISNIQERDLSYLPQAITEIPYMYVGLFEKGKAFVPQYFNLYENYVVEHGVPTSDHKIGYAVKGRMDNGGNVATVRILGQYGYVPKTGYAITGDGKILGVIRGDETLSISAGSVVSALHLGVSSGVSSTSAYFRSLSLLPSQTINYLKNIISSVAHRPTTQANNYTLKLANNNASIYVERLFQWHIDTLASSASVGIVALTALNSYMSSYSNSYTPTIVSQPVNGQVFDLFKINTVSDGKSSVKLKVGFDNINDKNGTFSMFVRDWNDTDKNPTFLETWNNLSLNPESERYIGEVLGNSIITVAGDGTVSEIGDFPNKSKYIYLTELNDVLPEGITAVPGGFAGYRGYGDSTLSLYEPTLPLKRNQYDTSGQVLPSVFPGVDFTKANVYDFLPKRPINMVQGSLSTYKGFLLYDGLESSSLSAQFLGMNPGAYGSSNYNSSTYVASTTGAYISASNNIVASNKFIVAVMGGFDGLNEEKEISERLDFANKVSGSTTVPTANALESMGYLDFKLAIDAIESPDFVDYKLLFTPSITNRQSIQYAFSMIEARADAFYVPDMVSATADDTALISEAELYDTSYGAVYYPGIKQRDTSSGKYQWYNSSIILSEVMAYNDSVAYPWYAAAGYKRGVVKNAYMAYKTLNKTQRDNLYSNRINAIATFKSQGQNVIVVWGNRTLQKKSSALSDVNIRRMIIEARKFVSSVANRLLFEPNDIELMDQFKRTTTPYFENVKALRGLQDFRVVMDSSTTSPDDRDNNRLNGSIILKPTKSTEEINIGFIITKQSANFDDL